MADLYDPQDLGDLRMKNVQLQDGESYAGLFTAYTAAQRILLAPSVLETLCSTFEGFNVLSNAEIMEKVRQIIKKGFHLYVCHWENEKSCAFHALPHPNNCLDLENIFLPKREINLLPKTGSHYLWDSSQKQQIILQYGILFTR